MAGKNISLNCTVHQKNTNANRSSVTFLVDPEKKDKEEKKIKGRTPAPVAPFAPSTVVINSNDNTFADGFVHGEKVTIQL